MDSKIDVIYCRYSSCAMLAALGVGASDEQVAIVLDASEPEAADVVLLGLRAAPELPAVAKRWEPRRRRKYDPLLDDNLLDACIIRDQLDVEGAQVSWHSLASALQGRR